MKGPAVTLTNGRYEIRIQPRELVLVDPPEAGWGSSALGRTVHERCGASLPAPDSKVRGVGGPHATAALDEKRYNAPPYWPESSNIKGGSASPERIGPNAWKGRALRGGHGERREMQGPSKNWSVDQSQSLSQ